MRLLDPNGVTAAQTSGKRRFVNVDLRTLATLLIVTDEEHGASTTMWGR